MARAIGKGRRWAALALAMLLALLIGPATRADLRSAPVWYDQNAVALAPDWHYRVPINVPAGATVNSTIKLDVDFAAQFAAMGVSGSFDVNSPRVVRSTGALAATQEFTDRVFAGATDVAGNARGEVRFLLEDAGAVTYYLYFDITQNGSKPANPQNPINGNFERGGSGAATPTNWNAATITAGLDAQIRPAETVSVTANPAAVDGVQTRNTDGNPNTGDFSYLMGNRSGTGGGTAGNPGVTLTKTIIVPATNPGNLSIKWRPEGWDTGDFDPIRIDLTNAAGTTVLVEMVGPTAGSYATKPFAPNTNNAQASNTNSGYRQYNGYDCNLLGGHGLGMTVPCRTEPWWTVTQSLAAYAGQTIRLRLRMFSDTADKTWYHVDDLEWSVVTATLGTPQAFGVNITAPAPATGYVPGQIIPVTAQVDAAPTAATAPVTAALFDTGGVQIAGPFTLYNDGSHGDATAGDAIWTNNGSVVGDAVTVPLTAAQATGDILRVFARDASTSIIGAQNGLARGPGTGAAAETQANYWNIDEVTFNVQRAAISISKLSSALADPVNNAASGNAKMIPGATVRYCLLVSNAGPLTASNVIVTDTIPVQTSFVAGSMRSGTSCATATTVEDDDNSGADEADPFGASFAGGTLITITTTLANGGAMALVFDVTIN